MVEWALNPMATSTATTDYAATTGDYEKETRMLDDAPRRFDDPTNASQDDPTGRATRTANLLVGATGMILLIGLAVLIVLRW